mgnify:CR=1 FL=1
MSICELVVEDFGPIKEGHMEFANLTVLTGPQNSGKTYLAMLFYALSELGSSLTDHLIIDAIAKTLYVHGVQGSLSPEVLQDLVDKHLDEIIKSTAGMIKEHGERIISSQLRSCFLTHDLRPLVRKGADRARITCTYDICEYRARISSTIEQGLAIREVQIDDGLIPEFLKQTQLSMSIDEGRASVVRIRVLRERGRALYIPAERFAIISSFSSYISLLLDIHRHLFEREFTERIFGRIGLGIRRPLLDYIEVVNWLVREPLLEEVFEEAATPKSVLELGHFTIEDGRIWYIDPKGAKLPVELASSGIAQLIGLMLPLSVAFPYPFTYDVVIVEEPEINLHPDLHIAVARFLAELSTRYKVFITTHSHYVLAELSNLLTSNKLRGIRAYYIDPREDRIVPLAIDRREGIELPKSMEKAISILADEALASFSKAIGIE